MPSASLTRGENAGHHKAGCGEALQISYLERFNLKQLICHLVDYDKRNTLKKQRGIDGF